MRLMFRRSPATQEGGFLIRDESGDILFSTGDMGFAGSPNRPRVLTQDEPATDYGRIFRLSTETFDVTPVAMGARNPQGAAKDGAGRIWFVDQGPMGGDEVNLVEDGANYGWPR
ncbi:MAG: PQQ-dependent sugar dehydrogenase [Gammaproteobacteria bacterium]|nr:PQQ-dependent sugar dehydrogenase [Gammaproteobacteria bacterium]